VLDHITPKNLNCSAFCPFTLLAFVAQSIMYISTFSQSLLGRRVTSQKILRISTAVSFVKNFPPG
jgi:hypothetical protein